MNNPTKTVKAKRAKRRTPTSEHYVNNKEFSQAVVDYVNSAKKAESEGKTIPKISEYIGRCFLRIAEGLSHKPNFIRYTYREEMVMDAVENCIKAIGNYNIEAATRTGSPNAFAYFTQISYFAFIRRITKEKKQQDIKLRYIEQAGISEFMTESDEGSDFIYGIETGFVDELKNRIDKVKNTDRAVKQFGKDLKSSLELFLN